MTRFTISTDPDGKSYLFGKNDPEPHEGFLSGGTELFAWEPEAVEALRSTLAATVELSALRERIAERVAHAQRRLDADPGSDYWRGALVAAVQVEITTRRSDEGTTYDVVAGDQSWSWSTPWTPGDPIDQTPDCPGIPPAAADRGEGRPPVAHHPLDRLDELPMTSTPTPEPERQWVCHKPGWMGPCSPQSTHHNGFDWGCGWIYFPPASVDPSTPKSGEQRDPELAAELNEQRRQAYNAETMRTRPVPSSDTPSDERACERPGCGHPMDDHDGEHGCEDCVMCPAYVPPIGSRLHGQWAGSNEDPVRWCALCGTWEDEADWITHSGHASLFPTDDVRHADAVTAEPEWSTRPVPSSDTPSDGAGCPSKDCTRGECIDCPPPTPIDGDSGRRMETLLSRFAWLADSARSEGFHEAAAAYTVCRDELSDALTPAPASPPVGGGRAPSPFETFQAGMAAGLLSDRHALIHDYTEAEVREEFRDWLEERAAAAAADRGDRA